MHGTTMIFLFNTPVFAGFANYLLPLQLGARDLAFPRLNAFSYWISCPPGCSCTPASSPATSPTAVGSRTCR